VARQSLFASLSEAECEALVTRSVCRAVRRGERLFREGEVCRGLYLLVEGVVRTYRASRDGHEQVLGVFGPGESLGEVSLLDEGPCLASARVEVDGRVLFLAFEEVRALCESHPRVMRAALREMGQRVRALAALVDRLALQSVPTRVASAVLELAIERGALHNGAEFHLPRTQEQLASELGTTREGVARALRGLRAAGVIEQRGSRVRVLQALALRRRAERGEDGTDGGLEPLPIVRYRSPIPCCA
jgi:CRP/FNR family transcriptional regulator